MLRNAIINSAMAHDLDENIRQMFLQNIERFTALHVAVLTVLDNPETNEAVKRALTSVTLGGLNIVIDNAIPSLRGRNDMTKVLAADLEAAGLLGAGSLTTMVTAEGLRARRTTELGRGFIAFISEPT